MVKNEFGLIKRYIKDENHISLGSSYLDIFANKENTSGLITILAKYYKRVYHKQFDKIDMISLMKSDEGQVIFAGHNSDLFISKEGSKDSEANAKMVYAIDVQDYWKTLVQKDIPLRQNDTRFVKSEPDRQPFFVQEEETSTNGRVSSVGYVIDSVGRYKFKPHVQYQNYMKNGKRFALDNYEGILPEQKKIESFLLIRGDNLYAAIKILQDVYTYLDGNPGDREKFLSDDDNNIYLQRKFLNYCLTQFAINGSKAYGLDRILKEDSFILKILFSTTLWKKALNDVATSEGSTGKIATKFETKKGVNPGVQYLASQSEFLNYGFSMVEYDNDINRDRIQRVNQEFKSFMDTGLVPSINDLNLQDRNFILRFRKLGREHANGLYSDSLKTMIVDSSESFMHEYGHLIDYNYGSANGNEETILSMNREFEPIVELYTSLLAVGIEDDSNSGLAQFISRHMSYYCTPTEIFARCFEDYLFNLSVSGYFLGKLDNSTTGGDGEDEYSKYMNELSYSVCDDDQLHELVMNYFGNLFPTDETWPEKIERFRESVNSFEPSEVTDLTGKLVTTRLDYNEMTPEQRHVCIKAKKYTKNMNSGQVQDLLLEADALYDDNTVRFPDDLVLIFQYDPDNDRIADSMITTNMLYQNQYEPNGYTTIPTKSMITVEQNFYELFVSKGVQQQLPLPDLIKEIKAMFKKN